MPQIPPPLTLLLWAVALYAIVLLFKVYRARHAIAYARCTNDLFKQVDLEFIGSTRQPCCVRRYFSEIEAALQPFGFRELCTYSSRSSRRSVGGVNFTRILTAEGGSVIAGVSYFLTPRWLYAPYLKRPWVTRTGSVTKGLVLESELSNGVVLWTHQLASELPLPPAFIAERCVGDPGEMVRQHQEKLKALMIDQCSDARSFNCIEDYVDFYARAKRQLAEFRSRAVELRLLEQLGMIP